MSTITLVSRASLVVYPYSVCSLELAKTVAPLVPGSIRGETPDSVILYRLYPSSPAHSSTISSSPLSMPTSGSKAGVDLWLSMTCLSVTMMDWIWYLSARLKASMVRWKHSSTSPGATTTRGNSPWAAWTAKRRSPWAV